MSSYKNRKKTWRDIGSGRTRHRIKENLKRSLGPEEGLKAFEQGPRYFDERRSQQQQQQSRLPAGWDLPRQSTPTMPGQIESGGVDLTQVFPNAFDYKGSIQTYQSYWEDPQKVAKWYDQVQANPETKLPPGIDKETLTGVYDYLKYRNQDISNRNLWRSFNGDPMQEYVRSLPQPTRDYVSDYEAQQYGIMSDAEMAPGGMSQTDYQATDFDWTRLTVEQKQDILNDPNFSVSKVVAPGQQGLILSDSEFDFWGKAGRGELPWWQPVAYSVLSNPKTTPLVQGAALTVMTGGKGLAMAIPMTLLGYGAQSENEAIRITSETLLKPFIWGGEKVEQLAGLSQYLSAGSRRLGHAAYTPEELAVVEQRVQTFTENPRQVFGAMKVFYETLGGQDVWVLGENEKVPVQPGYSLEDAVKRVLDGESSDMVLADYQRVYGINGVATDFLAQSVLDPLNVIPDVIGQARSSKAARTSAGATIEAAGLRELGVLDATQTERVSYLDARANIEAAKAAVFESAPATTGFAFTWGEAGRKFKSLIQGGAITAEQVQHMTPWERRVAGLSIDGTIKELGQTPKAPKPIEYLTTLQPKAKAKVFLEKFSGNIAALFDWGKMTDATPRQLVDVLKAAGSADMETMKNMGAEFMGSPEAYTTVGAVRDVLPRLDDLVKTYEAAEPNRSIFWQVQAVLGDEPRKILKDFLDGDARADWQRFVDKLESTDTPEAAALLEQVKSGTLKPETLTAAFKPFQEGNVAIHPQEFSANILGLLDDHMRTWGKDYFQLKQDSVWDDSLRLLKGAQSLLLLDLSPSAMINDFVNERVMMATTGTLGLTPDKVISKWVEDFGIAPKDVDTWQSAEVVQKSGDVVGELTRGDSVIGGMANALNKGRSYLLRPQASSRFNSAHAKQIYYKNAKTFWSRQWRVGKAFDRMPAGLESRLREYGIEPQHVYNNLHGVLSTKQLDLISQRTTTNDLHVFVDDAARQLGKDPADVSAMLDQLGVMDDLRDRLSRADTPEKRQAAFDAVESRVLENADIRQAQGLQNFIEQNTNAIKMEGEAGVVRLFNDISMDYMERKIENDRIWDQAYIEADQADYATAQIIKRNAARKNSAEWKRVQARRGGLFKAAFDGLGLDSDFKKTYLEGLTRQDTILREYFDYKSQRVEEFFNTIFPDKAARTREWQNIEIELNERFATDQARVLKIQEDMNLGFVDEFGRKWGEPAAVMAKSWTDSTVKISHDIHSDMVDFRKSLQGLSPDEKAKLWETKKPDARKLWMQRLQADMEGAGNLYKWDRFDPGEGTPTPNGPDTPPPPNVSPEELQRHAAIAEELQAQRQAIADNTTAIWDVAEQYSKMQPGNSGMYNRGVFQDKHALLGVLKSAEYGGDPSIRSMEDAARKLTPDQVREIFDRRTEAKQATIEQDNAARTARLEKARTAAKEKASQRKSVENITLLGAIKKAGGLDWGALEHFGESNAAGWMPGLFKKRGKRYSFDDMPRILAEEYGFPIEIGRPDDPDGVNQLIAMMNRQKSGEKVYNAAHDYNAELAARQAEWAEAIQISKEDLARIGDVDTWEKNLMKAADEGNFAEMADLIAALPEEVAAAETLGGETYAEFAGRLWDETETRLRDTAIAENAVRADIAIEAMQMQGETAMTKQLFRDQLVENFNLSAEQADAVVTVTDARAEAWARITRRDAGDWYGEKLAGTVRGEMGGELMQAGTWLDRATNNITRQVAGENVTYRGISSEQYAEFQRTGRLTSLGENMRPEAGRPGDLQTTDNLMQAIAHAGQDGVVLAVNKGKTKSISRFADIRRVKGDVVSTDDVRSAYQVRDYLFQAEKAGTLPKGAISFLEDGRAIISAFEKADVSTVVHEIGHVFRRELDGADLGIVEEWAGVRDGVWERQHEEKLARAFEKYLADGQAPRPALVKVFENFKTWMTEIYQHVRGSQIDIKITDEVRGVFDRLLGEERREPRTDPALETKRVQEKLDTMNAPRTYDPGDIVKLRDGTQATVKEVRPESLRLDNGKVVKFTEVEPLAGQENMFGALGQATGRPDAQQSVLFQETPPIYPPGGYDQASGYVDYSGVLQDGWNQEVKPVMDAMKHAAGRPTEDLALANLDPQTQAEMKSYLQDVRNKMASTKKQAAGYAEAQRDFGLLDYNRQYGFDKVLSTYVPYEFYGTRTGANWIPRIADRPAWISHYLRLQQLHNTQESQLPERMRNKFYIPMPFLPEWAGGGVFVDPTYQLFPFKQFTTPLEALQRDDQQLRNSAGYILRDMAESGQISMEQAQKAMDTQQGGVWEQAFEQAKIDQGENRSTAGDYFGMLLSPALYLTVPYYLATGKKSGQFGWPSGQLPITRFGQGIETAFKGTPLEWAGNIAGKLAAPERYARQAKGLNEFGEWGEYYIERQLANMVAEGAVDTKEAERAMMEKKGPLYEQATERVRQELMLKVPGMAPLYGAGQALKGNATLDQVVGSFLTSLFPGGLLPPGEMEYKGLKQEYSLAWEAKKNGNDQAINKFFDEHPEYSARLALRRDTGDRMNNFLRSEIWDALGELSPTDRKQATAFLGPEFKDKFYDSENEIPTEMMVKWVRMLKGMVPETGETQPFLGQDVPQIDYFAPQVTQVTDRYFTERKEDFPHYYQLQSTYYSLPKSDRSKFLVKFPELAEYFTWKKNYYDKYPELKPVFNGEVFQRVDTSAWPPALTMMVTESAFTGDQLPSGAASVLYQVWVSEGEPWGDFSSWVEGTVYPGILNQQMQELVQ